MNIPIRVDVTALNLRPVGQASKLETQAVVILMYVILKWNCFFFSKSAFALKAFSC